MRLRCLVFVVGVADGPAVGEEDEAAQVVERLAAVELPADPAAKCFVGKPAQGVEGAKQLAVLEHRLGERVLARAGLELGDQQRGGDVALFERAADPQQVVPVRVDQVDLGVVFEQRPRSRPLLVVAGRAGPVGV